MVCRCVSHVLMCWCCELIILACTGLIGIHFDGLCAEFDRLNGIGTVGDIWGYPEINVGKSISYLRTLSLHFVR